MELASPGWLLLLIPWVGVAVWVLRRRLADTAVPFIHLWETEPSAGGPTRALANPPAWVWLLLVASGLSILAAAEPKLGRDQTRIHWVIDRGLRMSATIDGTPRYRRMLTDASSNASIPSPAVSDGWTIVPPPQTPLLPAASAYEAADRIPPTAVDTASDVPRAISAALRQHPGHVVAVTDAPMIRNDPRLTVIVPPPAEDHGRIERFAATAGTHPQAMVVAGVSGAGGRVLEVQADGPTGPMLLEQAIEPGPLPQTFFVPIPPDANQLSATLTPPDATPANDVAWLIAQPPAERVQPLGDVPSAVRRVIDAYNAARNVRDAPIGIVVGTLGGPSDRRSGVRQTGAADRIAPAVSGRQTQVPEAQILDFPPPAAGADGSEHATAASPAEASPELPSDLPVVLLPEASDPVVPVVGPLTLGDDPRIRTLDPAVLSDARIRGTPPIGFVPLASDSVGRVAVALRSSPPAVWVGLESDRWIRDASFPAFFARVLDTLQEGDRRYVAFPPRRLPAGWRAATPVPNNAEPGLWPGVWVSPEGSPLAVVVTKDTMRDASAANRTDFTPDPTPAGSPTLDSIDATIKTQTDTAGESPGETAIRPAANAPARGAIRLAPWLLSAALVCVLGAAWRAGGRA